jgi:transcriptional regulator with XRE-family HTH domain
MANTIKIKNSGTASNVPASLEHGELAIKMGTSQSTIARLESGKSIPSMRTLTKFAQATQAELQIIFRLKKI